MKPAADGVTSPGGEYDKLDDCAERICAARLALACCRPAASCRNSDLDSFTFCSASRLVARAAASRFLLASSSSRNARTWFVRTAIVRNSAATSERNLFVCSRCTRTRSLAVPTWSAIDRSWVPSESATSAWSIRSLKLFEAKSTSSVLGSPCS